MVPKRSICTLMITVICVMPYSLDCMQPQLPGANGNSPRRSPRLERKHRLAPDTLATAQELLNACMPAKVARTSGATDAGSSARAAMPAPPPPPPLPRPSPPMLRRDPNEHDHDGAPRPKAGARPASLEPVMGQLEVAVDELPEDTGSDNADHIRPMFSSPRGGVMTRMISMIDEFAQHATRPELLLDMFIFTNGQLVDALERAHQLRPDMRISINVMAGQAKNRAIVQRLNTMGIDICETPENHEKRLILHDKATGAYSVVIGSLNASYTAPQYAKDTMLPIHADGDSPINRQLYCLQQRADHERIRLGAQANTNDGPHIAARFSRAPDGMPSLTELLQAGTPGLWPRPSDYASVCIGTMTFNDETLALSLKNLKHSGADVQVICDASALSKRALLEQLAASGVDLRIYNPYGTALCPRTRGIPMTYHTKVALLRTAGDQLTSIVDTGNRTQMGQAHHNVETRITGDEQCYADLLAKFKQDQQECIPFDQIEWQRVPRTQSSDFS